MLLSKSKGEIAQLKVMLRAAEKNFVTSRPVTDTNYDLIIDDNKNNLIRIQIKYCNRKGRRKNTLLLSLDNKGSKRLYYSSCDVDLILVFVPKLDKILCYKANIFHKKKQIPIHLSNKNSKWFWANFEW